MPLDKFRLYIKAIVYNSLNERKSYIHDIVSVISGIFGKKSNKIIQNQLESLDM